MAFDAGKALVAEINAALSGATDLCRIWALDRVIRVRKRDKEEEYSILVQTDPKAVFQGWVNMRAERGFRVSLNQVSRMDVYGLTSACVIERDYNLKECCYCK